MIISILERALTRWRTWRARTQPGALGAWYRDGGNEKLWQGLPVDSDSLIIDAGGFKGEWTCEMLSRYGCRSMIFEPVPLFYDSLRARFMLNDRVRVIGEGLDGSDRTAMMVVSGAGSSAYRKGTSPDDVQVTMRDVLRVFGEVGEIACMKLNIEGGEYDVLERIQSCGLAKKVKSLIVQFHAVDTSSERRREEIRSRLAQSHRLVFDYPFVWERWDLDCR